MSTAVFEIVESNTSQPVPVPSNGAPAEAVLTQVMLGSIASQALYVAAKLGIADQLVDGPKTTDELATAVDADAPSLYRVLRALASIGVFEEQESQVFALTPSAEPLRSNVPNSLRDVVIFWGEDWHWEVWGKILYSVKTGKPAWAQLHGEQIFDYFAKNQEAARVFDRAMSSFSTVATKAVVEAYDFSGIDTLIDIAGGHGRLLNGVLEANPSMRGVLFDLSHVIESAKQTSTVSDRCDYATGDFFVSVPTGGDAYMMKHIIHDWDDERAITILKNIREAMNAGGRVLVVESVIAVWKRSGLRQAARHRNASGARWQRKNRRRV